jgi:hypothetical protein
MFTSTNDTAEYNFITREDIEREFVRADDAAHLATRKYKGSAADERKRRNLLAFQESQH